jgi:O-glycosyl hydrolase
MPLSWRGVSGTTPINWIRTISDTYSGGAPYRNRAWINGAVLHQEIDGLGAGAVFLDAGLDPMTDANMDGLYGTAPNQTGLTLIRLRIAHD